MIDRIADDVGQRIADHLDHLAVELNVAAVHHEQNLLGKLGREIAHHARQRGEQPVDPLHAGARDRFAHLGDAGGEALERSVDHRVTAPIAQPAREFIARQHHVRHARHHPIEQIDWKADAAGRGARREGGQRRMRRDRRDVLDRGSLVERQNQRFVTLVRRRRTGRQGLDQSADAVDDRQHGAHQPTIGHAIAVTHLRQRAFSGMAQALEPGQI